MVKKRKIIPCNSVVPLNCHFTMPQIHHASQPPGQMENPIGQMIRANALQLDSLGFETLCAWPFRPCWHNQRSNRDGSSCVAASLKHKDVLVKKNRGNNMQVLQKKRTASQLMLASLHTCQVPFALIDATSIRGQPPLRKLSTTWMASQYAGQTYIYSFHSFLMRWYFMVRWPLCQQRLCFLLDQNLLGLHGWMSSSLFKTAS